MLLQFVENEDAAAERLQAPNLLAETSSQLWAFATCRAELIIAAQDSKSWAKKVPQPKLQHPSLQAWLKKPKSLGSLAESTSAAYQDSTTWAERRGLEKLIRCGHGRRGCCWIFQELFISSFWETRRSNSVGVPVPRLARRIESTARQVPWLRRSGRSGRSIRTSPRTRLPRKTRWSEAGKQNSRERGLGKDPQTHSFGGGFNPRMLVHMV